MVALVNTKELTELFVAGIAGNHAAYRDFLTKAAGVLRRIIGRKIPANDVEDVLQEVLLSIHKARHTYDDARPLLPWLVAITGFRVSDYLRKSYSEMRRNCVDIADVENVLEAVTEAADESEPIDKMLDAVAVRERKILSLMHVEGYTAKQIGTQLGMKESAVKVAAHRAIKKIRKQFSHG